MSCLGWRARNQRAGWPDLRENHRPFLSFARVYPNHLRRFRSARDRLGAIVRQTRHHYCRTVSGSGALPVGRGTPVAGHDHFPDRVRSAVRSPRCTIRRLVLRSAAHADMDSDFDLERDESHRATDCQINPWFSIEIGMPRRWQAVAARRTHGIAGHLQVRANRRLN